MTVDVREWNAAAKERMLAELAEEHRRPFASLAAIDLKQLPDGTWSAKNEEQKQ